MKGLSPKPFKWKLLLRISPCSFLYPSFLSSLIIHDCCQKATSELKGPGNDYSLLLYHLVTAGIEFSCYFMCMQKMARLRAKTRENAVSHASHGP